MGIENSNPLANAQRKHAEIIAGMFASSSAEYRAKALEILLGKILPNLVSALRMLTKAVLFDHIPVVLCLGAFLSHRAIDFFFPDLQPPLLMEVSRWIISSSLVVFLALHLFEQIAKDAIKRWFSVKETWHSSHNHKQRKRASRPAKR